MGNLCRKASQVTHKSAFGLCAANKDPYGRMLAVCPTLHQRYGITDCLLFLTSSVRCTRRYTSGWMPISRRENLNKEKYGQGYYFMRRSSMVTALALSAHSHCITSGFPQAEGKPPPYSSITIKGKIS